MTIVLQQPTLDKMISFAATVTGGENSQAYQALLNSLLSSSELAEAVNGGIVSGEINGFSPTSVVGVGGQFDPSSKTILIPVNQNTGELSNGMTFGTMVFVMAHEVRHSVNAESTLEAFNQFHNSADYLASFDGVQDYTATLLAIQKAHATDEATAQIAGWNAVVSEVNSTPGVHLYSEYRMAAGGYGDYFMTAGGAAMPGLAFNSNYTIQFSESNIDAERELYFYNPNVKVGSSNYPNYYGAKELSYIASKELYDRVAIDMDVLRFDPFVIKNNNLLGLTAGQSIDIVDLHTGTEYTFDSTSAGQQLGVARPIIIPSGHETERLTYNEFNVVTNVEHDWQKDDGSSGHDSADNIGNKTGDSVDADGTNHWFFKYASGGYGDGFSSKTENFSEVYNSDGTFNKDDRNYLTGARSYSYKNSNGSFGDYEHNADGSSHEYLHNADGSYSESSTKLDGSTSSEYKSSNGFYSKDERGADGSTHNYSMDANGYYSDSYNRADGSSSYESLSASHYYSLNITYADSSSYSKSISPDGSVYIGSYHNDGAYETSYTLANGETSTTVGDGVGDEDTHLILADKTDIHIWRNSDGTSGSETTDNENTLTQRLIDSDHAIHDNVYKENGDYTKLTTHDDGTFEKETYDVATDSILFETYDLDKTRHNYGNSVSNPNEEHFDSVTYKDGSGYGQGVEADGDYSYWTTDSKGYTETSRRDTLIFGNGEKIIRESTIKSDHVGIIDEQMDVHDFVVKNEESGGGFEELVEHVSNVRTDLNGYDSITTLLSIDGVIIVGGQEINHQHYLYG
ncbi:hypothetical protein [Duganella hordei]|uniref:hypothetical protein n=1 Tax=Duganella hordei TaxID=2865934 RepID=UPI0030E8B6DF